MQIHLCKPGGEQEGPYTLEQVKQDLAANKYRDTDYWAWHEGLTDWVPLYSLPGLAAADDTAAPESEKVAAPVRAEAASPAAAKAAVSAVPAPAQPKQPAAAVPTATDSGPKETAPPAKPQVAARGAAPAPAPEEEPAADRAQVSSGLPAGALEQVFLFTSGDGPSARHSPTVTLMVKEIVGEDLGALGENVSRDVVAWCAVGELLKPDGSISDAVWRAMAVHRPTLVQQAREKLYRVCVRTFRIEGDTVVALVLFYNKQKL